MIPAVSFSDCVPQLIAEVISVSISLLKGKGKGSKVKRVILVLLREGQKLTVRVTGRRRLGSGETLFFCH